MAMSSWFLYDAVLNVRYCVVFFIFSDVLWWQGLWLRRQCMSCSHCDFTVCSTCKKMKSKFGKKLLILWNSENEWQFHELKVKSLNNSNRCEEDLGVITWEHPPDTESEMHWQWLLFLCLTPSYLSSYHYILLMNYCNGVYQLEITELNVMLSSYFSTVAYHILKTDS